MTVDDVFVVRGGVAVSGRCVNRKDFTPKLVDREGAEYMATVPFIKHVVPPEFDYITLELNNTKDPRALQGQVLSGQP